MIKIPTDNLYKFLSIFGIVLICIGVNNAIATLDIYKMKELEVNKKIMKWKSLLTQSVNGLLRLRNLKILLIDPNFMAFMKKNSNTNSYF